MNTAVPFGGSVLTSISVDYLNGQPRLLYKGDGDMSNGLVALGYSSGVHLDYGISPQAPRIDPSSGLVTRVVSQNVVIEQAEVNLDIGFVVFNHGAWAGGDVFVTAFPNTGDDPVLNNFPSPAIHLNIIPLPTLGNLLPSQVLSQSPPGNLFFRFRVPLDGNAIHSAMTPGTTYRVVLWVTPPVGVKDDDPNDNWVSTGITLTRR